MIFCLAEIAQSVEQRIENPRVTSSILVLGIEKYLLATKIYSGKFRVVTNIYFLKITLIKPRYLQPNKKFSYAFLIFLIW